MERSIHVCRTLVFLLLLVLVVPAAADNLRIHVLPRPDAPALLPVIEPCCRLEAVCGPTRAN